MHGPSLSQEIFLVFIPVRVWVKPRVIGEVNEKLQWRRCNSNLWLFLRFRIGTRLPTLWKRKKGISIRFKRVQGRASVGCSSWHLRRHNSVALETTEPIYVTGRNFEIREGAVSEKRTHERFRRPSDLKNKVRYQCNQDRCKAGKNKFLFP
jgi:hypothetical protein